MIEHLPRRNLRSTGEICWVRCIMKFGEIIGSDILVISVIVEPYCGSSTKILVTENRQGYDVVEGLADARLLGLYNYVHTLKVGCSYKKFASCE